MLKLSAKVEIKGEKSWTFQKITACEIVRDSEALTTTCKVTLPRKVKWKGETSIPIRRGDKISVWLGYDDNLQLAFSGYVLRIGNKAPLVLECEDEMFNLKNKVMDYSLISREVPIADVLRSFTDFPVRAVNFKVNSFYRSSAVTAAQWLSYMKSFAPDKFFFREIDGNISLVCLNCFTPNLADVVDFYVLDSSVNIISDSKLQDFQPGENDVYVKISVLASLNQKRQFVERGSEDKAIKRFIYRKMIFDVDVANRLADFIVEREGKSGLRGSLKVFGFKLIWPFDIVGIKLNGERKGKYQVHKNTITYGSNGFRQDITLGARAAE